METYIYAHISMTDTDTHTHIYIYICLSLGHLSGYLYLTLQVFKRYIGIALNHQIHMHSNSSKTNKQIYVYILYIYILSMCVYMYIYIYILYVDVSMYMAMSIYHISPGVQQGGRQVQTGTDRCRLQPFGMQHALGSIVAVSLAQLSSQQVLQISHCQRASLGTESSQPPFLSGICGQG